MQNNISKIGKNPSAAKKVMAIFIDVYNITFALGKRPDLVRNIDGQNQVFQWKKKIVLKFAPMIHQTIQNNISKIRKNPLAAKKVMAKMEIEKKWQNHSFSKKMKNSVWYGNRGLKGR